MLLNANSRTCFKQYNSRYLNRKARMEGKEACWIPGGSCFHLPPNKVVDAKRKGY